MGGLHFEKRREASYHCRFMETPRYLFEKAYGGEYFLRVGEMTGLVGLAKILTTATWPNSSHVT